jgi:hypothetical protein
VDDVRFFTGVQVPTQNQPAERYEELGQWVNEFDLSPYFPTNVDQITLGQLSFNAYLPRYYAGENFPNGTGSVIVTAQIVDSAGVPKQTFPNWAANYDAIGSDKVYFPLVTDTGAPVTVVKGDRLQYTIEITAGRNQAGYNVLTPIVDDVSIVYFLPNSRVLLQERVNQ